MIKLYLAPCTKNSEHEVGKKLAEYALSDAFGVCAPLCHDERGKPYFDGACVFVSISHSHGLCLAAVSEKELGADIEHMKRDTQSLLRLAQRYFTEDEAKYVKALPNERFFEIWCAKESYIKYTGEGLSRPLGSFSVLNCEMTFSYFKHEAHMIAVCSDEPADIGPIFIDTEISELE